MEPIGATTSIFKLAFFISVSESVKGKKASENKNNLDLSVKKQNSKLFVAYYLNRVRLIDNF